MDNILADSEAVERVRVYEGSDDSLMISSADTTQELTLASSATSTDNTAIISQGIVSGRLEELSTEWNYLRRRLVMVQQFLLGK